MSRFPFLPRGRRPRPVFSALLLALSLWACAGLWHALTPGPVQAFEQYAVLVPCRATALDAAMVPQPCVTCHDNVNGGNGPMNLGCPLLPDGVTPSKCLTQFGFDFRDLYGLNWERGLALLDSDGDGYSNGQELGDPDGVWRAGDPVPSCDCVSRPGWETFTPGDVDGDGDGVCCVGEDLNGNGNCLDPGELTAAFDCDDALASANSLLTEDCSNPADNDCDGFITVQDPECVAVVDRDGDGFCPMGEDLNGDGDCLDGVTEMTMIVDCDDTQITVFPGNFENCGDGLDNDCNGDVDDADSTCRSDIDNDMDGFCPRGTDLNGDGDCTDPGEEDSGFDCNDTVASVNPSVAENCTDGIDNDCDGFADFTDSACVAFFDADRDGFCPTGRDGDGNGSCTGPGEADEPGDCDDANPAINPAQPEICTDAGTDEDCDDLVSLADDDCAGYLDTDGDDFCFIGYDINGDGDCADVNEQTGNGDCRDDLPEVNPRAIELCTDGLDNECDGGTDSVDPDCAALRDNDRDGFCLGGRDLNGDFDCDDAGEQGLPTEVDLPERPGDPPGFDYNSDFNPKIFPGAPEDCNDGDDNDLNGLIDLDDPYCVGDVDADGDGWCPVGRDLNGDGDCLDAELFENSAEGDCDDQDTAVNPDADEQCREIKDYDCDGAWRGADIDDCAFLNDVDGDGFCPMGIDDNGDRDCEDAQEDRFGRDCNDNDPAINARAEEICDDEGRVDEDCDGSANGADTQCTCTDSLDCDDGNPCTLDECAADQVGCVYRIAPECADAGDVDGGLGDGGVVPGSGGCAAAAPVGSRGGLVLLVLMMALALRRRRRG